MSASHCRTGHMSIPNLKRVRLSTETELRAWLARNTGLTGDVMLVTSAKTSSETPLNGEVVRRAVRDAGLEAGRSCTLNGGLVGRVVGTRR